MAEQTGLLTSLRRLPLTTMAATILAILAALSLAQHLHAVSHRYDDIDFSFFYGWWSDYSTGGDPWAVSDVHRDLRPGVARPRYCNYTPFFVEVLSPLARLDQKTSFWVWQTMQLLCLAAAVIFLARANAPPLAPAPTIIVLSLVLLSRQFAGVIASAQFTPMLLALLAASWFCMRGERPAAAGLWLAIAALLKLYPAAAAGYFLFGRRWRALVWTIVFFAIGVLLTNPWRWIELITLGMPVSYHASGRAELTVLAFVRKIVAYFAGTRVFDAPVLPLLAIVTLIDLVLLAIAAMASLAIRGRDDLDGLLFGMWIALALLMSPLAWLPETLLLLPLYLFGMLAAWNGFQPRETSRQISLLAGAALLTLCIMTALIKAVPHPGFAALMAAYLGGALIFRARIKMDSSRDETRRLAS